jgi:GntP family gluconate:H+ symporter
MHAFFALFFAAMFVGLMAALGQTGAGRFAKAVESAMTEFGVAAGKIGFTIAIAAVIGVALMDSGAADKIIRRFIAVLGEKRAPLALMFCGFVLSIPVFFDTVFFLLVPLARALSMRTGKNYLLYVLAICAGGVITHGTVPPTPGPLVVAETLHVDLGVAIVGGLIFGILPALAGLGFSYWADARGPVALRETAGSSLASLEAIAGRKEDELPGFWVAIAPVIVPVVLIAVASFVAPVRAQIAPGWLQAIDFLGNKNVAMLIGAVIALAVYARQKKIGFKQVGDLLGAPLETAGVIILITAAGGAYGAMIQKSGVGESVQAMANGGAMNYVLLAWLLAAVIRVAQGSATVAMITASSIMLSIAGPAGFGVHIFYIYLAVGYGATTLSWMNDSGFWVIGRLGGLTEGETLRSWTVLLTVISIVGLLQALVAAALWPNLWF